MNPPSCLCHMTTMPTFGSAWEPSPMTRFLCLISNGFAPDILHPQSVNRDRPDVEHDDTVVNNDNVGDYPIRAALCVMF